MADKELDVDENNGTTAYITTVDNPYNPQTQFDEWLSYDTLLGYNTTGRLAKTVDYLRDQLKTDDSDLLYEAAILEMVRLNPLNVYTIIHMPARDAGVVHVSEERKQELELAKSL